MNNLEKYDLNASSDDCSRPKQTVELIRAEHAAKPILDMRSSTFILCICQKK